MKLSKEALAVPVLTITELKKLPDAPDFKRYFAVGPNVWAKSRTAERAFAMARQDGGAGWYFLHLVNESAEVHPLDGALSYDKLHPGNRLSFARVRARSY